jgi:hypothetical protein
MERSETIRLAGALQARALPATGDAHRSSTQLLWARRRLLAQRRTCHVMSSDTQQRLRADLKKCLFFVEKKERKRRKGKTFKSSEPAKKSKNVTIEEEMRAQSNQCSNTSTREILLRSLSVPDRTEVVRCTPFTCFGWSISQTRKKLCARAPQQSEHGTPQPDA